MSYPFRTASDFYASAKKTLVGKISFEGRESMREMINWGEEVRKKSAKGVAFYSHFGRRHVDKLNGGVY